MKVVGFYFSRGNVILVRMDGPGWQKDLYNGVLGDVRLDESPLEAMIRTFKTVVGHSVSHWERFAYLEDYDLHCFRTSGSYLTLKNERADWADIRNMRKTLRYLSWLVPMAISHPVCVTVKEHR